MEKLIILNNYFIYPGCFYGDLFDNKLTIYTNEHIYKYTILNWVYFGDKISLIVLEQDGICGIFLMNAKLHAIVLHYSTLPCDIILKNETDFNDFKMFFTKYLKKYEE